MPEQYSSRTWEVKEIAKKWGPSAKGTYTVLYQLSDGNVETQGKTFFKNEADIWPVGHKFEAAIEPETSSYGTDLMIRQPKPAAAKSGYSGFHKDDPAKELRIMRGNALNAAAYALAGKGKDSPGAIFGLMREFETYLTTDKRVMMSTPTQREAIVKMFSGNLDAAHEAVFKKFGRVYLEELTFEEADTFQRGVS